MNLLESKIDHHLFSFEGLNHNEIPFLSDIDVEISPTSVK